MEQGSEGSSEAWAKGMPRHMMPGMRWRGIASIVIGFGWAVFILLFAGFLSDRFTLFQNLVVFFASIVVAMGLMAVMWAGWGMRSSAWCP